MKRLIVSLLRTAIHIALAPLELILRRSGRDRTPHAPVFIIGPPRSGTTLLYELMVTRWHFAYLSNLAHRFYRTPLAASFIGKKAIMRWHGAFESRFGHIQGWGAPNEGGWNWKRHLPDGPWSNGSDWTPDHDKARALTCWLERVLNAPFLNKNVMHANRLGLMNRIWPHSLFIVIHRDVADNVRSIVRAERKMGDAHPGDDLWFSVRPSIAPQFEGQGDVERGVAQVMGVEADVARDRLPLGGRVMDVDYDRLCTAPHAVLTEIEQFLIQHKVALSAKSDVPARFDIPGGRQMAGPDERRLTRAMAAVAELLKK